MQPTLIKGNVGNQTFHIPDPLLYYLGGLDPHFEWKVRGLTGHDALWDEKAHLAEQQNNAKERILKEPEQKKLALFLNESLSYLKDLLTRESEQAFKRLNKKQTYILIGPYRSGGTYLFTELCQIFRIDYQNLNQEMIHDGFPHTSVLVGKNEAHFLNQLNFQMSLLFNWIARTQKEHEILILKNSPFGHALSYLDHLLPSNTEYLCTLRHPLTQADSIARYLLRHEDPHTIPQGFLPFWQDLLKNHYPHQKISEVPFYELALKYWEQYYLDIASAWPLKGDLKILSYGPSYDDYLKKFFPEHKKTRELQYHKKEWNPLWPQKEQVEASIEKITQVYRALDIDFPEFDLY